MRNGEITVESDHPVFISIILYVQAYYYVILICEHNPDAAAIMTALPENKYFFNFSLLIRKEKVLSISDCIKQNIDSERKD